MWGFFNEFMAYIFENVEVKHYKSVKITKKILCFSIEHYILLPNLNIWPQILEISYPDFSRIIRIRFFPGIFLWAGLGGVEQCPIF